MLFMSFVTACNSASDGQNRASETKTVTVTVATPASTVTVTAAPAAPPPGPETTMGDGIYAVGKDVAAGSYKSAGPKTGGMCAWTLLPNKGASLAEANGGNTIFGPGYLAVSEGQIVQLVGGCKWTLES